MAKAEITVTIADLPQVKARLDELTQIAAARAEEAARWRAKARNVLTAFEELFAGGPDTSCRTTWHPDELFPECSAASIECVEVPMADLRETFDRARAVLDAS